MILLPAPAPFIGGLFERQLHDAGLSTAEVSLSGTDVRVAGVQETDRAAAENVLAGHAATARALLDERASEDTNETSIRDKAAQALTANTADIGTNDSYLAITSPTNAQVASQVKELTRQSTRQARELNALIRLVLRRFESAD